MKLHTTIRSLGFGCFGELQISAADHTMVPSKKRRCDGRSGMMNDGAYQHIFKSGGRRFCSLQCQAWLVFVCLCHVQTLCKMTTMNCWDCLAGTILHAVCHTLSELISVRGFRRDRDLGPGHIICVLC